METRFLSHLRGCPTQKLIRRPTLQYRGSYHPPLPIPCSHHASKLSRQPHEQAVEGRVDIHKKSSKVVKQIRGLAVSYSSTLKRCSRRRVCNPPIQDRERLGAIHHISLVSAYESYEIAFIMATKIQAASSTDTQLIDECKEKVRYFQSSVYILPGY